RSAMGISYLDVGRWTFPRPFDYLPSSAIFQSMDNSPNDPAEALLRTYSAGGGINYLDAAATLPSRPAIDEACVDLLSLLFPGFHGEPVIHPGELPELTRSRIRALHARLHPEMCKSLARRE